MKKFIIFFIVIGLLLISICKDTDKTMPAIIRLEDVSP